MEHRNLHEAVELHQRGQFVEAERIYRAVLREMPDHFDALHLLGVLKLQQGRNSEALNLIGAALQKNPNHILALSNYGAVLLALKRFEEAVVHYRNVMAAKPDYAEGYFNLALALSGVGHFNDALISYNSAIRLKPSYSEAFNGRADALRQLGHFEESLASYDEAISLKPRYFEAFLGRGIALKELRRFDEALKSYDMAIALIPNDADAFYNRGIALTELKRFDEALVSYDRAIALKPDHAHALYNRGNILSSFKRYRQAVNSYDQAITASPGYAEAFNNRGLAFYELGLFDQALKNYDSAISLKADYADALSNRGNVLKALKRFDEAEKSFERALTVRPDAKIYYNLGVLFIVEGRWQDAIDRFERALALEPNNADAGIGLCMAQLPVLYMDEAEICTRRAAYRDTLKALCEKIEMQAMPAAWADSVGSSQPFLLAYQGKNDRELQSLYGDLVCRIMTAQYPSRTSYSRPHPHERVRVGVVSGFFHEHSNWYIPIKGWLSQLDRNRFCLFGYHTGTTQDAATEEARALCERFTQGPLSIADWRTAIQKDAPHVLIYPEVGIDPTAVQLAAQRLAPVQCNSWGHPDTSGFPTLDYYLTSDLMEPPGAKGHYSERLVRLPNLSIYYEPHNLAATSLTREELGLRTSATIYWSGQSISKYLPQFDYVFPRIAKEVGDCQFVFIQYQSGTYVDELFRRRLERAFAAFGLKAWNYCVFLPRLDPGKFVAAIGLCDIVLDSIEWSGCNSTLEGLQHNLPIVTMAGTLMRGRHTMAILKMMEITETTAMSVDDYISMAVRLALDPPWRTAVKNRISEGKHRIYCDRACIEALEEFLDNVSRGG